MLDSVEKDVVERGGVKGGNPVEEGVVEGVGLAMLMFGRDMTVRSGGRLSGEGDDV